MFLNFLYFFGIPLALFGLFTFADILRDNTIQWEFNTILIMIYFILAVSTYYRVKRSDERNL